MDVWSEPNGAKRRHDRTYTTRFLPEKVAFLGVERHSIVSVGSYGQLKDRVNRYYFEAGMDAMMETLEPEIVLVYSQMPNTIENKYPDTKFVEYPDWTSMMRKDKEDNREQRHATVHFDKSDTNMLTCLLQR